MKRLNRRMATLLSIVFALFFLAFVAFSGVALTDAALAADLSQKNLPPSAAHLFGTDWMGRDMLARTLCGLSLSIRLGVFTAAASAVIALLAGAAAGILGSAADAVISWAIDLAMGVPHILLLILISFACGKGLTGVAVGISATHWMSLARLMRGEILQLRESGYIKIAEKLGVGRVKIAARHMLPHLFPQFLTGLILLFPHAILHEASITFLGFGLSPEQPAIGIILSESVQYLLMGKWWLCVFPGILLVATVMLFSLTGEGLRRLLSPAGAHE